MTTYDEDLSENPFYQTFLQNYVDLFSQCVYKKWIICVPRRDSLPKHAFTLEDFTHHILKPLLTFQEMKARSISGESTGSNSSSCSYQNLSATSSSFNLNENPTSTNSAEAGSGPHRKWNFRTLTDVKLEYTDNQLYFNVESSRNCNAVLNNILTGHPRSISVLFEETYYTTEKQKYKVLCIASPLNSKVEDLDTTDCGIGGDHHPNGHSRTSLWNLTSLRDCIDFLWLNGKSQALESFDAYIKLFLHNHQSLEDLPLAVQRDLVFDIYKKCLSFAMKSIAPTLNGNHLVNPSVVENAGRMSPDGPSINETNHLMQNFKLATETYVLSGIYRQLINAITSALSHEDAGLNKVTRNLSEVLPQDLGINSLYWENILRAKNELGRLSLHASPLAKLNCLRKTMRHLKQEHEANLSDFEGAISTEELLPIWVYLIIKTPMGNWLAQLQFLRHFRFSAKNIPDNENSFLIVTLEASLAHLSSGKISGLAESEMDVGISCEVGDTFLRNLSPLSKEGAESPLAELFNVIRQGNFFKLEELVTAYEKKRDNAKANLRNGLDFPKLCHPLCQCADCALLTKVETESNMKSIYELSNEDGLTLLHVACVYGRPKIVDFLVSNGSPVKVVDLQRMTPLHYAASRGHQNALLLMLHAGSELEPLDKNLNTPLHLCAMNGHETCVKALIYYAEHSRQHLSLSARNTNGDTPLHFAARFGFHGIVHILVEVGASITMPNAKQASPMDCAHDIHIVRILHRYLRRRSLTHTNHGDFVNIDVVRKSESDGVVMLISEPNKARQDSENTKEFNPTTERPEVSNNRSSGILEQQSGSHSEQFSSTRMKRDTSCNSLKSHNVYGLKFVGGRRSSNNDSVDDQDIPDGDEATNDIISVDTEFFVPKNSSPKNFCEPEHLKKVSVENLEASPYYLATKAVAGLKRKRAAREQGLRKLFKSITVGDVPLALFYLGISTEELEQVDSIAPGELVEYVPCHPLCVCNRCSAKSSGLDFSINVRNAEGLTPLHLAVQYNLHPLVKILLKYNADPKLFSIRNHKTALQIAKENYFCDIATTLEDWEVALSQLSPP